jgi:hypothetical protein
MNDENLNRFEKEKKVIELYKEGRTIRDITGCTYGISRYWEIYKKICRRDRSK